MNVYTHFEFLDSWSIIKGKSVQNGIRWRTLLHYGTSWDIIGSVVMMNPGSSNFKVTTPVQGEILTKLKSFENGISEHDWYEFNEDNAMINVGKLFSLKYGVQDRHELNGVIQVFNLFYLKDQNLERAKTIYKNCDIPDLLEYDLNCLLYHNDNILEVPVYLGYGALAIDTNFRRRAETFFNAIHGSKNSEYLNPIFDQNKFYYPTYIVGKGKNRRNSKIDLGKFLLNINTLSVDDISVLRVKYGLELEDNTLKSNKSIKFDFKKIETEILKNYSQNLYDNKKRIRQSEKSEFGITIAEKRIEIRPICLDFNNRELTSAERNANVISMLQCRGYKSEGCWLGRRMLSSFGVSEIEIIENVIKEIRYLLSKF